MLPDSQRNTTLQQHLHVQRLESADDRVSSPFIGQAKVNLAQSILAHLLSLSRTYAVSQAMQKARGWPFSCRSKPEVEF
jgi:hypothetical protein